MKDLMEIIKQKMINSVTSINKWNSPQSDQCSSQTCLNLARTYEILNSLDKKETTEPIATINPAEELSYKHWEECRQIALYDDDLRQMVGALRRAIKLLSNAGVHNDDFAEIERLTNEMWDKIYKKHETTNNSESKNEE